MIERFKCSKEDFEEYLDEQDQYFNDTTLWKILEKKSDYDSGKYELGYQVKAASKAKAMASKLGLNDKRVSFYTKCLGAAFPMYGREGRKRFEEYAKAHNIPYDEKEVFASTIEEALDWSGGFVFEGLRPILLELFDLEKDSTIQEVELAKLYHEQMEILKPYTNISSQAFLNEEIILDEQIEKEIKKLGISATKHQLIEYKNTRNINLATMEDEEIEDYYKKLDSYKDYAGDECFIKFLMHEGYSY